MRLKVHALEPTSANKIKQRIVNFHTFPPTLTGQSVIHAAIFYKIMLQHSCTNPHFCPLPHGARDFDSHPLHASSQTHSRSSLIHNSMRHHSEKSPSSAKQLRAPSFRYVSTTLPPNHHRTGNRQQRAEAPPRLQSAVPLGVCVKL